MDEDSHLLVTRPIAAHFGRRATDAAVHLGNGNGSPRLSLDLVEKPARDPGREGQHIARIARRAAKNRHAFVPERHRARK
jgi:hypothetical protein